LEVKTFIKIQRTEIKRKKYSEKKKKKKKEQATLQKSMNSTKGSAEVRKMKNKLISILIRKKKECRG